MAIHSQINQYVGINAHLQSYFQNRGGWASFHNNYIRDLAVDLDRHLPPGYLVDVEQSLQVREYHPDTGERVRRPQPDITVFDTTSDTERQPQRPIEVAPATLVQPVVDTLELNEDLYYPAVVIFRQEENATFGEAITRIELLSPTNKQGHGEVQYREKRIATLKSGVQLIEVDFLHETPSPIGGIPVYPTGEGAFPYAITVSNPNPTLETGLAETYGFHVEEPVPRVAVPLAGQEAIAFDFGAVYNTTFRSLSAYGFRVDYATLPDRFDRYSPPDQAKIRTRMQVVQAADALESGPFPLSES